MPQKLSLEHAQAESPPVRYSIAGGQAEALVPRWPRLPELEMLLPNEAATRPEFKAFDGSCATGST